MEQKRRRMFLAAMAAAPLLADTSREPAAGAHALALNGGKPVRATRLPASSYPGTQFYDEKERLELTEALESRSLFRWYGPGSPKKVATFEEELNRFMGTRYALAVTSGTAALHCALTALGVGPGDEVILPAWTWFSCYNTILLTGALPVFAEVDESFTMDPADLERKITPRTKAVMVVHLYGGAANMDGVLEVARRRNVRVLEDAAQSVGAQYRGKRVGSIGDIGIYSFQISKTITAGEGGAVVTSDPLLFERASRFHDLGMVRPPHQAALGQSNMPWNFAGTNYRMNEMTGGVMCAQLRKLESILSLLRRNARAVHGAIRNVSGLRLRRLADPEGEVGHGVYLLLPSQELRDKFVAAMRAENVPASPPGGSVHLPSIPYIEQKVALHPAWPSFTTPHGRAMRYGAECCPRTLDLFRRCASVSLGPKYTDADANDIAAAIAKVHQALLA